jgi:squalene-associated FAD-dependent desaturase
MASTSTAGRRQSIPDPRSLIPDPFTSTVAIIGGGFAGLSAAVALADAGVRVHVFEARPTLGGRANAFRDPLTGERIDNGQHILAGCYYETLAFLRRIGSASCLHRPSTLRVPMIDERGVTSELVFPALPPPLNLLAGILAWDVLTLGDRWAILQIGDALRGIKPVDPNETVRQWLTRHHQSARLCRLFWEPLALAALNQSIDDASAEMFVAVTSRMFGNDPEGASILVPSVPLDDLYVTPAVDFLATRGCEITTHSKARILTGDAGTVTAVRAGEQDIPVAAVICAVPWFALADAFVTAPRVLHHTIANATALGSAPIVTVNLWFDGWRSPAPMLGLPGRVFQWIFDRRVYVGNTQRHLSLISSGAEAICAKNNDELIGTAVRELREAFSDARTATLQHATVIRERRATFSLKPGSPPRPGIETDVPGLFLAGDWIDTGLPATIESAVIAGHRAAAAALQCLQ